MFNRLGAVLLFATAIPAVAGAQVNCQAIQDPKARQDCITALERLHPTAAPKAKPKANANPTFEERMKALREEADQIDEKMNFKDRQAIIIDNTPQQIELSAFKFENKLANSGARLHTDLKWKNTSKKPIVAFEVVILRYDPFNRSIPGSGRWMITGHDSANWSPLMPGQSAADGLRGYGSEAVMTSIVYVRAIRYEDGGVWTADIPGVEAAIRQKLPVLKDLGNVNPPITEQRKE